MSHDDFEMDPIKGLPETPPPGERILWQGSPSWKTLSRRLFHIRKVAVYFGILMVWQGGTALVDGLGVGEAVSTVMALSVGLLLAVALLSLLAWLTSRNTVYTVTSQRLAIRFGIALPMTINIPFSLVDSANLKAFSNGAGDISLKLNNSERVSYLVLWPHVRPWYFGKPEPTLRSIPKAASVAKILGDALAASPAPSAQSADDRSAESSNASGTPGQLVNAA